MGDYIEEPCPCTHGAVCPHYGLQLVGRLWELSRMEDDLGRSYRALWVRRLANPVRREDKRVSLSGRNSPCRYFGGVTGEKRDCAVCGGKKSVPLSLCGLHGRCTAPEHGHLVYRDNGFNISLPWCRTCPDYEDGGYPLQAGGGA